MNDADLEREIIAHDDDLTPNLKAYLRRTPPEDREHTLAEILAVADRFKQKPQTVDKE